MSELPKIIEGGLAVDERGQVVFVNDFKFDGVKRFYVVSNHKTGFVRAWHGHKKTAKYIFAVSGSALVGVVKIDDWEKPSKSAKVDRFCLSAIKPSILYIPAGYASGFMNLNADTQLMYFSTGTLEQSNADDFRYDARYWDIWHTPER